MSKYVEVEIDDVTKILVEVDSPVGSPRPTSGLLAKRKFVDAIADLKTTAGHVLDALEPLGPQEIELEFGVKVDLEGQTPIISLAKASVEANYKVVLKWDFREKASDGSQKLTT